MHTYVQRDAARCAESTQVGQASSGLNAVTLRSSIILQEGNFFTEREKERTGGRGYDRTYPTMIGREISRDEKFLFSHATRRCET